MWDRIGPIRLCRTFVVPRIGELLCLMCMIGILLLRPRSDSTHACLLVGLDGWLTLYTTMRALCFYEMLGTVIYMSTFTMMHISHSIVLVYWALAHVVLVVQVRMHLSMIKLLDVGWRSFTPPSSCIWKLFDLMGIFWDNLLFCDLYMYIMIETNSFTIKYYICIYLRRVTLFLS